MAAASTYLILTRDGAPSAWLIVAAYAAVLVLALVAARRAATPRERLFWIIAATALLALGINKQLDLQTQLTAIVRGMAREQGWYGDRRAVQKQFIIGLGLAGLAVCAGLVWLTRGAHGGVRLALVGLAIIICFILVRAASFHHFDWVLRREVAGLRTHVILELAGITIVGLGAIWGIRAGRARR